MGTVSTGQTLRAAATKLRDTAQQAAHLNGPKWFHSYGAVRGEDQVPALITRLGMEGTAAAEYAALADPAFGLIVADMLEEIASQLAAAAPDWTPPPGWKPGLLALAILGDGS